MTQFERNHGGTVPRYLAILVAAVLGLSLFPATANAAHNPANEDPCQGAPVANEYVDRNEARDVHENSIDCVIFRRISIGSSDSEGNSIYLPRSEVRRDQMASFIYNALVAAGYDDELDPGTGADEFGDISGNAHGGSINALAREGIIRGTSDNTFSPAQRIRRDQMASFMVQAANWAVGIANEGARVDDHPVARDGADRFVDVSAGNPHKGNIEAGADAGLFTGETASTFAPGKRVQRDQMATFLVRLLKYIFNVEQAPPPAGGGNVSVTVSPTTVAPGGTVTGSITGDNVTGASVSGPCVQAGTLQDTDAETAGVQYTLTIQGNAAQGSCTLTFTVQRSEGGSVTVTRTLTITGGNTGGSGQNVTAAPELQRVEIVDCGVSNPDRALFRYVFDETVRGFTAPAGFNAITFDAQAFDATRVERDPNNENAVLASFDLRDFNNSDTLGAEGRTCADITTATVEYNAVADLEGNGNVEGSFGVQARNLAAGITCAPDLVSITDFDAQLNRANFNFDERIDSILAAGGSGDAGQAFHLILADGTRIDGVPDPSLQTGTNPAGRLDDDTIRVVFDNRNTDPGATDPGASQQLDPLTPNDVTQTRRGYVDEETVVSYSQADGTGFSRTQVGCSNPLQAVDVNGGGNTNQPDLVSITLDILRNTAIFTFDEDVDVLTAVPSRFFLYDVNGNEMQGQGQARRPSQQATTQILIEFPRQPAVNSDVGEANDPEEQSFFAEEVDSPMAVDKEIVGGSVDEFAVISTADQRANRADEEGIAQTFAAGETSGPELTDVVVTVTQRDSITGNPTNYRITATFDECVYYLFDTDAYRSSSAPYFPGGVGSGPGAPDGGGFVVYDSEGTPYETSPTSARSGSTPPARLGAAGDCPTIVDPTPAPGGPTNLQGSRTVIIDTTATGETLTQSEVRSAVRFAMEGETVLDEAERPNYETSRVITIPT